MAGDWHSTGSDSAWRRAHAKPLNEKIIPRQRSLTDTEGAAAGSGGVDVRNFSCVKPHFAMITLSDRDDDLVERTTAHYCWRRGRSLTSSPARNCCRRRRRRRRRQMAARAGRGRPSRLRRPRRRRRPAPCRQRDAVSVDQPSDVAVAVSAFSHGVMAARTRRLPSTRVWAIHAVDVIKLWRWLRAVACRPSVVWQFSTAAPSSPHNMSFHYIIPVKATVIMN